MSKRSKKAWAFVEANYPNYSSSDEIKFNRALCKLNDGQCEPDSYAEQVLHNMYLGTVEHPAIKSNFNASLIEIYERAIENYLTNE